MANQQQALRAYAVLSTMGKKVTGKTAFQLFKLKQELKQIVEFQVEEEQKLVEKYHGKITETGKILIDENQAEFNAEYKALGEMECDIEKVSILADSIQGITMDEIEALVGFIDFE